jgi:thimet oligopeptidase
VTPETILNETRQALADCRERIDAFAALPEGATANEVVAAFDSITGPLNGRGGRVHLFAHVHPDAGVRDAALELEQEIGRFRTEFSLDRRLYDRLSAVEGDLAEPEQRLLEHALRDFRRAGVDRDDATRDRIRSLQEELVEVGQRFDRNIITGAREVRVPEGHAGLGGLPADFLTSHPEEADGSVVLSTDPHDRMPLLTYADDQELKRRYFVESMNRAVPDNLPVLDELLAKRSELAGLLGYDSWADYVTEDKMIGSAAHARTFIDRVIGLAKERGGAEYDELLDHKRRHVPGEEGATCVYEWEWLWLAEQVKRARHGFDSQAVRPYFAYARVRDGILSTSAALYGVRFERDHETPVWHETVECWNVIDGDRTIARFYLDMHPRDEKYKHAAMFHLAEGVEGDVIPEACLVCNFPEPTGDDPALLLHDQVTTFFHEFGHLLHHLFGGEQRYLRFSGISTEWDFVEVPSQMYEEWAWDPGVLAGFALHHETGEPISEELVASMRAADEYGKALNALRQMSFAQLSLDYHELDTEDLDPTAHMIRVKSSVSPFPHEEGTYFHASFGHLQGYSAMYYTYMWSLVIAKDVFSRFDGDLMNTATANDYRKAILAAGGSRDAAVLVRDFLGRDYGFEAFETWLSK